MVRILVVDDSVMDRRLAGGLLEKQVDWQVAYASDGVDALQRLEADTPDVIVTDLQMPEMNGLELVREIRRRHLLTPVILMTAQGSETIAVEALQVGAASYVPKRLLANMLAETVHRVLGVAGELQTKRTLMQRMSVMRCEFVLSNDPTILASLVSHLQSVLNDMGALAESEHIRVGVALEEALLNAAYHGNLEVDSKLREQDYSSFYAMIRERSEMVPYCDRSIYVDAIIRPDGLRYIVRDEGPGFDPSSLPDPTDPVNLDRPSGRGVLLMRTFMDEVQYNEQGNQVTMTKSFASDTAPASQEFALA